MPTQDARRQVTLERTYRASLEELWDMWTTSEGIESWWGPEGFEVRVRRLDLRPRGELAYTMTAVQPDQVDFLRKAGMPVASEHLVTYTEVAPLRRLAYRHLVDFVPGVKPYDVTTVVELDARPEGVRMILTIDAMHDESWTGRAVMGWESQLGKLARVVGAG
jgi:uncharacterized protein YndB with AHSA1/START domain